MRFFRSHLAVRRGWLVLLLACTLAVRLAVPTGFMPVIGAGGVTLQLCSGMAPSTGTEMAMPGMHHGRSDREGRGRAEAPCAFAGLGLSALGSADPLLLVAAVVFAFLLVARAVIELPPPTSALLRPPLRAPPRFA